MNGAGNGSSLRARPYAPPIDPIFGSGIAIAPARIPGRLTSRRLVGSTGSVIFRQRDPHRRAVWRVCHIPPRKLPDCFGNLSMHSCAQARNGRSRIYPEPHRRRM
jgi:hypothetical protein